MDLLAPVAVFGGHMRALDVIEREIVVVVNCDNWHFCSETSKCRPLALLLVHHADGVEVARVGVDVVAQQHEYVSVGAMGYVIEESVARMQALRIRGSLRGGGGGDV
jgi:hypothetical protein